MRLTRLLSLLPVASAAVLSACAQAPAIPIPSADLERLTRCGLPLTQVRTNLERAGYPIIQGSDKLLETDFRKIEAETQRFLLGTLSEERWRKYRVEATPDGVHFETLYQTVSYPHNTDRDPTPKTRVAPVATHRDNQPLLEQIHAEVCADTGLPPSAPTAATAPPIPASQGQPVKLMEALIFINRRCEAGDTEACGFLQRHGLR